MNNSDRAKLRKILRSKRHALSELQLRQASQRLSHRLLNQPFFIRARRIGFYFASDSEIDPLAVLFKALEMNKHCYLPLISTYQPGKLDFKRFREGDPLQANKWGILEPASYASEMVAPFSLNLVFLPLVGFDPGGNRLGMGKGFYDKTFSYLRRGGISKPKLIGLAHECQKVAQLAIEPWDIPLEGIITDQRIYWRGNPLP